MAATPKSVTKTSSIPIRDWTMCRKSPASRAAAVNAPKVRAWGDALRSSCQVSRKSTATVMVPTTAAEMRQPNSS